MSRPPWKSGLAAVPPGWSHIGGLCQLGVELVAAFDEVGFDVHGELSEPAVALDFAEAALGFEHPRGGPAQAHLAAAPVLDGALDRADGADHRLARVRGLQGALELAGDPKSRDRERLLHSLAQ